MESELTPIVTLASTLLLVGVTIIIAFINKELTTNTKKSIYGNIIFNFQDKLSATILKGQEMTWKYPEWEIEEKGFLFDNPELIKTIESFLIEYLNVTNAIAYLFVMKDPVLEKDHKEYFGFYIAYAKTLLDVKNMGMGDDQSKYWRYIKQCVEKHDMKSDKTVPKLIEEYYRTLKRTKKKK